MKENKSLWNGFERVDFELETGVRALTVRPRFTAEGKPWYWRARFFGAFPFADLKLLENGWHVAAVEVDELYGGPEAIRRFDLLYSHLALRGFDKKCVIAGYSRGGLETLNWAEKNPDKLHCIYLDNAVCDFRSWPGAFGKSRFYPEGWSKCLVAYGLTEEEAKNFKRAPLNHLDILAKHDIPILCIAAYKDEVVAPQENTDVLVERYKALGGRVMLIRKEEAGHHPHSLENPQVILNFIKESMNDGKNSQH